MPTAVADQLLVHGIDAVSARTLDQLGDTDINHLQRATRIGRVLCTHDQDFLRMANEVVEHAGIAFAQQYEASIGGWVRALRALHTGVSAEDAVGRVFCHLNEDDL